MEFPTGTFNDMSEFLSAPPQPPFPPPESRRQRRNRHHGGRHHRKPKKDKKMQHMQHQDIISRLDKICNILDILVKEVIEEKTEDNLSTNSPFARPSAPIPYNTNRNSPVFQNKKDGVVYDYVIEPVATASSLEPRHPFDLPSPAIGSITQDKQEEPIMSGALPLTNDIIEDLVTNFYWLQQDLGEAVRGLCELRDSVNSVPVEAVRDAVHQLADKLGGDLNHGLAHLELISNRQKQAGLYDYLCSRSAFMLTSPVWQRITRAQAEEALQRSAADQPTFGSSEDRLPDAIPTSMPPSQHSMVVPTYSNVTPSTEILKVPRTEGPAAGCPGVSDTNVDFDDRSRVSADTDWDVIGDLRSSRDSKRSRLSL
ncbi:hypothetical protein F5X99DRAFT_425817 [Biscogniauxia marginata]|nr:hypothetical protein F5X99DRAFT_425817 [Biscogniauxia marginata]